MISSFLDSIVEHAGPFAGRFVVVTHVIPDRHYFLDALAKVAPIAAIIPKPKSIHQPTLEQLRSRFNILHKSRTDLEHGADTVRLLGPLVSDSRFILLDMGGYFASSMRDIAQAFPETFIGVIEDTENGRRRYEREKSLLRPVIQVARSPLKETEDHLVGGSIVFSADRVLRAQKLILNGATALVIGYGRIGQSIAASLRSQHATTLVHDIDPIKQVLALSHGYQIPDRDTAISQADLIFCATGNKSITYYDFDRMKRSVYIFTATSSDDELMLSDELVSYSSRRVDGIGTSFVNSTRTVYLVNDGNAVNFLDGAVVGQFIYLVQAEMIYATSILPNLGARKRIAAVSRKARQMIAQEWIRHTYVSAKP